MAAMRTATEKPTTAPNVPKPIRTKPSINAVFAMDCMISITLFRCFLSKPVKAAVAVFTSPPLRMNMEVIWISWAMAGRWNATARKSEIAMEKIARANPKISSKVIPETNMLLILDTSFWWLYWAEYLTMAVVMPQSLKLAMRFGADTAMK